MGVEIERKILVKGNDWRINTGNVVGQGYLNRDKNRTLRVRLAGDQAFLTIKGHSALKRDKSIKSSINIQH